MKKLVFELEFITPAFIGNAYQRAELRPASFVGLLRWWWRALKGEEDIKRLYEEECKLFGGHLDDGAIAGCVSLKLQMLSNKVVENSFREHYKLEWFYNQTQGLVGKHAGVGYLLYSVSLQRKENPSKPPKEERSFIKAGSRFRLVLLGKEECLKPVVASLWALVFLGGVGTRARRGGGDLSCVAVEPQIDWLSFEPKGELSEWLSENLRRAVELVGGGKDFCSAYSNLSFCKLLVSKESFNSWIEALNQIGKEMMDFRRVHKSRVFEMGAFGLPIQHRNRIIIKPMYRQKKQGERDLERRASPLIVKVIRIDGKYHWIVLRLNGELLPKDAMLVKAKSEKDNSGQKRLSVLERWEGKLTYRILEEFSKSLRDKNLASVFEIGKFINSDRSSPL